MKKKKYLPLYDEWMHSGERLPKNGLCQSLGPRNKTLLLFEPRPYEHDVWYAYWGYDGDYGRSSPELVLYKFTAFRQNVVLFLAAMNNEL